MSILIARQARNHELQSQLLQKCANLADAEVKIQAQTEMLEDLKREIAQVVDSVDQTAALLSLKESTCTPISISPDLRSLALPSWQSSNLDFLLAVKDIEVKAASFLSMESELLSK